MPAPSYAPQAPEEATAIDDVVSEYAIKIYPLFFLFRISCRQVSV